MSYQTASKPGWKYQNFLPPPCSGIVPFMPALFSKAPSSVLSSRRRTWQPTPVFLPGESQGRGSLVVCRLWGGTESDTTEATEQECPVLAHSFSLAHRLPLRVKSCMYLVSTKGFYTFWMGSRKVILFVYFCVCLIVWLRVIPYKFLHPNPKENFQTI